MYLSRLLLNPRSRQVQRDSADPYQLHRTVLRAFADPRQASGVLHRLDVHPRTGQMSLLVQSQATPHWGALTAGDYLLPADPFDGLENPAVKAVALSLVAGQVLSFRLRANPTIKKARRDASGRWLNSNRVPLVYEDQQYAWLASRAARGGFRVLQAAITGQSRRTSSRQEDAPPLTLFTVQFDGRLQIIDSAAFQTALAKGIGPARAFGCGLLSLAPA
jgi:CRISPR system Cascade subunit CasE